MFPVSYYTKLPSELTDQDLKGYWEAFRAAALDLLVPWADHLLACLSPEQAVEALRQMPDGLWPQIAREIVLSCNLIVQDPPPLKSTGIFSINGRRKEDLRVREKSSISIAT